MQSPSALKSSSAIRGANRHLAKLDSLLQSPDPPPASLLAEAAEIVTYVQSGDLPWDTWREKIASRDAISAQDLDAIYADSAPRGPLTTTESLDLAREAKDQKAREWDERLAKIEGSWDHAKATLSGKCAFLVHAVRVIGRGRTAIWQLDLQSEHTEIRGTVELGVLELEWKHVDAYLRAGFGHGLDAIDKDTWRAVRKALALQAEHVTVLTRAMSVLSSMLKDKPADTLAEAIDADGYTLAEDGRILVAPSAIVGTAARWRLRLTQTEVVADLLALGWERAVGEVGELHIAVYAEPYHGAASELMAEAAADKAAQRDRRGGNVGTRLLDRRRGGGPSPETAPY